MKRFIILLLLVGSVFAADARYVTIYEDVWVRPQYYTYYVTIPYIVNGVANYRYEERVGCIPGYWTRVWRTVWVPDHCHNPYW